MGQNLHASRYAGIKVQALRGALALLLSGAFAGLAGAVQVFGVNYRMIRTGSATGFTGSAGFNGIVAALFGQLHPLWSIPASILFGALLVGANKMQRVVQVPVGPYHCIEWSGGGVRGRRVRSGGAGGRRHRLAALMTDTEVPPGVDTPAQPAEIRA